MWRSGQTKACYVYRFFAVGSLEEVCYERQCSKEGLAGEIVDGDGGARKFSNEELKALFRPKFDSTSTFHDRSGCKCFTCGPPAAPDRNGFMHLRPGEAALLAADACLSSAAAETGMVSLAFTRVTDKTSDEARPDVQRGF